jgi:hypothetical protein
MAIDDRLTATDPGPAAAGARSGTMPKGVKLALAFGIATLLAGAVWLFSVRGEALLIDLYAAGARIFCL